MSYLHRIHAYSESEQQQKAEHNQYAVGSNCFFPATTTVPKLPAGMYEIGMNMGQPFFKKSSINTDELLKFEDPTHQTVLNEIDKFWSIKDKYEKLGFLHNRALLLYGNPGSGKSCLTKLVLDKVTQDDNIVFISNNYVSDLIAGLRAFREIESNRQCLVVLEDVDAIINRNGEHSLLELLDGANTVDNILYLGTTNFINKIPARILRPGRFDRKILVDFPPAAGRYAYLFNKLEHVCPNDDILKFVEMTDGLSFGHLREFLIGLYCLGHNPDELIKRLRNTGAEVISSTDADLPKFLRRKV
jgi:SpoVK/Ycf46/Vps4 family AAA+-type ATPase